MSLTTFPDWLFDARAWLRSVGGVWGARVFFDVPDPGKTSFPLLRLYASAGPASMPGQDAPLFDARLSIEVWGKGRNTYPQVRQAALQVQSAVFELAPGRLVPGATTYCGGAYTTAAPDSPAADTGDPRIVVDAVLSIRAAGPADP